MKMKISETLKIKIAALVNEAYEEGFTAGKKAVDLAGIMSHKSPSTPNQQRAALIQQAKDFVKEQFYHDKYVFVKDTGDCTVEFIVNAEKRTVVAILRPAYFGKHTVRAKGIAKCHPDEVFNVDIGKAIALARALQIPVPTKFLRAVQPTWAVGQVMQYKGQKPQWYFERETRIIKSIVRNTLRFENASYTLGIEDEIAKPTIIDDTEAEYAS